MTAIRDVATLVFLVAPGPDACATLRRLLGGRDPTERWALLHDGGPACAIEGVAVRSAGGGCPCCVGSVPWRVALTALLREVRPAHLALVLALQEHAPRMLRTLRDPWLAPIVTVAGVIALGRIDPESPAGAAALRETTAVCVPGDSIAPVRAELSARGLTVPVHDVAGITLGALTGRRS